MQSASYVLCRSKSILIEGVLVAVPIAPSMACGLASVAQEVSMEERLGGTQLEGTSQKTPGH